MKNVKKNVKYKNSGFTLIELLAVIIILGILMIIAIPSVTSYINNSRKSAYVDSAKEIIAGARNFVNEGKVPMYDTSATYYIKASCISTENGQKSPYGDFKDDETYVIVTYDGNGYEYYWVSRDETGQGVPTPTKITDLDEDDIKSDIEVGTIKTVKISDDKSNVLEINETCNDFAPAGESGNTTPEPTPSATAASTILAKYMEGSHLKADAPLNQIPDTNIYIFKGENPANYVKFNGEDWRIIGIYGNQLKIQRIATLGTQYYDNTSPYSNVWADSDIKTYLNTTYYNESLSDETIRNMIDNTSEWNVGAAADDATASAAYNSATETKWKGADTSDPGIGLMASYEFLYASGGNGCDSVAGNYGTFNTRCGGNDWMTPDTHSWTMTGKSDRFDSLLYAYSYGGMVYNYVTRAYTVTPAILLKPYVKIESGDGKSIGTAYVLQ